MLLKVIIEPGEDRGFIAHVPALRGCWSQGDTKADAMSNIKEAIEAWLEVEQDKADQAPHSGEIELITV